MFVGHKTSEAGGESDVVEKSEVRKERRERKWEEGISKDANDKDVDSPEAFAYHLHKEKPNDYKELAVLACVINCLFGIIALSFACEFVILLLPINSPSFRKRCLAVHVDRYIYTEWQYMCIVNI